MNAMQLYTAILTSTIRMCAYWFYPATTLLHRKRNILIFFCVSIVLMIAMRPLLQLAAQPFVNFANGSEAILNYTGSQIKDLERAAYGFVDLEKIIQNYREAYPKHFDDIITLIRQSDFDDIEKDPNQSVLNGGGSSIWALKRIIGKYEQWHNKENSTTSDVVEKLRERLNAKDKKNIDGTLSMPINELFSAFLKEQEGPAENSVTYKLGGHDAAAFEIDPATGEVRIREQLDYERKNKYEFEVIAQKAQSDKKVIIKKELIVEDTRYSPVRGGSDNQPLDPIKETDPAGKVIYRPKTVSSDSTRSDSKFLGFLNRLQFSVHWLLLIIGALTPFIIATLKWHDETIRNIFAPYFLLLFSESIALVIAKLVDIDSAAGILSASELLIGIIYTLARILQLSGFLIYKRQFSIRRWLRNFLICLVALWSLNFIGLLNQPFIY
jgi:hypothetical protein